MQKKNITAENYILSELKKVSEDPKLLNKLMEYEKDFYGSKIVRNILKDKEVKNIVDLLIDLKKELQKVDGSIKYQFLMKYPDIIGKVDNISNTIINLSLQCQKEIDKYIKAKQKLLKFQYSNIYKLEEMKEQAKQEAEKEIIKLIGNQVLYIERKLLNSNEKYTYIKYNNESRNLLDSILTALYYQAEEQKKFNRNFEKKFKKQLSKQAKKELAIKKSNSPSLEWEE